MIYSLGYIWLNDNLDIFLEKRNVVKFNSIYVPEDMEQWPPNCTIINLPCELNLRYCTSLTSLPNGLSVNGEINAFNSGLTSLPTGLSFKDELNLRGCTSLSSFPSDIESWGNEEEEKDIYLTNTGFSEEQLEWVRNLNIPGLTFYVDRDDDFDYEENIFKSLNEGCEFWFNLINEKKT